MNLPDPLAEAVERVDGGLVHGGYHAVSVSAERVRAWLRFRRWPFVDPAATEQPSLDDLDHTAAHVVARSVTLGSAVSGVAALGGAMMVPPEAAASVVVVIRMVQRLCVVYGFDPETDRGRAANARALAAAWNVELPEGGAMVLRVSDVPRLVRGRAGPSELAGSLARAAATGALSWAASRITRLFPLISAPSQVGSTRRHLEDAGARATAVLRKLAEVSATADAGLEEALEVP